MANKKKKAVKKIKPSNDWILRSPEDIILIIIGAMGFAELMPTVTFGVAFAYAWPILVVVIGIKKLIDNRTEKRGKA